MLNNIGLPGLVLIFVVAGGGLLSAPGFVVAEIAKPIPWYGFGFARYFIR